MSHLEISAGRFLHGNFLYIFLGKLSNYLKYESFVTYKYISVGSPLPVSEVIAVCRAQEPGPPAAAGSCVTAAGADTHLGSKLFKAINVFTPNE